MTVSANAALSQLMDLNRKEVDSIPDELTALASSRPIYVFNVSPKSWVQHQGSFGTFTIHAKEEGQRYSKPLVVPAIVFEAVPNDIKTMSQRPWSGRKVVDDIICVGAFKSADADLRRWGVFVTTNNPPTEQEIADAEMALQRKCIELVQQADALFMQGPNEIINISADHRWACNKLNLDREWNKSPKQMIPCPGCGEPVHPEVAIHGGRHGCGSPVNQEKAIKLGLWKPPVVVAEQEEESEHKPARGGRGKQATE